MTGNYFTAEGLKRIRQEIQELERFIKIDVAKDLQSAAAHGDLRENAEYQAAKEKQSFAMTRLRELRERARSAEVVRPADFPEDRVTLLKWVRTRDLDSGEEETLIILGENDTDLEKNIISYQSPLAAALMGKKKGEVVDAELPGGTRRLEIVDFAFHEDA